MNKKYCLAVILVLGVFFSGCKKENDKKEYCRITKLIKNGTEEIDIKFGDNEKISAIENKVTKELSTYKYVKDTVFIDAFKNGNLLYKLIITNNKDHFATNVKMMLGPNEWINQAFTYENGRVVHNLATNSDGESETASYIWENGNVAVLVNEVETTEFQYYSDKNFQDGDFNAIQYLLGGYRIHNSKNLLKSAETNGKTAYYTYTFDDKGRITEAIATANNTATSYKIEYECP